MNTQDDHFNRSSTRCMIELCFDADHSIAYWVILNAYLSNAVFLNQFYPEKFFQEHYQSFIQFGSKSGPTRLSGLIWVQT